MIKRSKEQGEVIRFPTPRAEFQLEAYHGIWALSTTGKDGQLKCSHIAYPVVFGSHPLWVIATVGGKFLRYADNKEAIARLYPRLVWRRWMVRWQMLDNVNHSIAKRREEVATTYGVKPPVLKK